MTPSITKISPSSTNIKTAGKIQVLLKIQHLVKYLMKSTHWILHTRDLVQILHSPICGRLHNKVMQNPMTTLTKCKIQIQPIPMQLILNCNNINNNSLNSQITPISIFHQWTCNLYPALIIKTMRISRLFHLEVWAIPKFPPSKTHQPIKMAKDSLGRTIWYQRQMVLEVEDKIINSPS
jgi:hypothetical protein